MKFNKITLGLFTYLLLLSSFILEAVPSVTELSVRSGPSQGGTVLTLAGSGFTDATTVHFGPKATSTFTINSDTSLTVTSPVYVPATVHVTVSDAAGTSPTTEADYFVYTGNYRLYSLGNAGLIPIDTAAPNIPLATIPYGFTNPNGLALSPNGDMAYVLGVTLTNGPVVLPIDLTTHTTLPLIKGFNVYELYNVIVAPDHQKLYLSTENFLVDKASILPIDLATSSFGTEIFANVSPPDIIPYSTLLSGDGQTAYLLIGFTGSPTASSSLLCFDVPSSTQVGAYTFTETTIDGMSLSPDGNTLYATQSSPNPVVNVVDVSDRTAPTLLATSSDLTMLSNAYQIAISPDGTLAYITDYNTSVQAVDLTSTPPNPTFAYQGLDGPLGVCVSPDGLYVYTQDTTQQFGIYAVNQLNESNLSFNSFCSANDSTLAIPPLADSLKISPDQAPLALFTAAPAPVNSATSFDASASVSPTGSIASYSWDFGDSNTGTGVSPSHTYTATGTYNVKLTVTNTAGTSTALVTTGQTISQNGGPSAVSTQTVTIQNPPPVIVALTPSSGPTSGGNSVIIDGINFLDITTVTFGETNSPSFVVNSPTQITAVAPAGAAGTVNVTVTTPVGTSPSGAGYAYVAPPTITSLSPASGPLSGGTSVLINGTDLTTVSKVTFGSNPATSFIVVNPTTIAAVSPADNAGIVSITATSLGGTSLISPVSAFTYVPAPTVTGLSHTSGPTVGGTSVVITGTNLTGAKEVLFGSTPAASFSVLNSTTIAAVSPPEAVGNVSITVETSGGFSAAGAANHFTYIGPPSVVQISPSSGPLAGETSVIITGTNLSGATAVIFGTTHAASYTVVNSTTIAAVAPPEAAGVVNVTVVTPEGVSAISTADQYTYVAAPFVASLSPIQGPSTGGTFVVINGANLSVATHVKFGSTNAISYHVNSSTQITAIAPAGNPGLVHVTVTTAEGTSPTGVETQYTYVAAPTVVGVSPNLGPIAGGTSVVITGTNLSGATSVNFGTVSATSFNVVNATTITAVAPAEVAGTVNVTVTTPGGTTATSSLNRYTYR